MALSGLFATQKKYLSLQSPAETVAKEAKAADSDFEKAVELIKKYEGLHQSRHWPLVGYGHKVLPGEKYSRSRPLGQAEAEALLRKDLLKNCAVFREFGADSLILGVLAYNIGSGAALRSSVARKLKAGDRDIYSSYVAHSKYRGKTHTQIKNRRIEEFETLFIKDPSSLKLAPMPVTAPGGNTGIPSPGLTSGIGWIRHYPIYLPIKSLLSCLTKFQLYY